uniref:Uncharacterized protein n=1 Tax=Rhizophora mucronata TaxID=61149 RepID=A0A2P2NBW3_RHIMU
MDYLGQENNHLFSFFLFFLVKWLVWYPADGRF